MSFLVFIINPVFGIGPLKSGGQVIFKSRIGLQNVGNGIVGPCPTELRKGSLSWLQSPPGKGGGALWARVRDGGRLPLQRVFSACRCLAKTRKAPQEKEEKTEMKKKTRWEEEAAAKARLTKYTAVVVLRTEAEEGKPSVGVSGSFDLEK